MKKITAEVPDELHGAIRELADRLEISMTAVVREMLTWAIEENAKPEKAEAPKPQPGEPYTPEVVKQAMTMNRRRRLLTGTLEVSGAARDSGAFGFM